VEKKRCVKGVHWAKFSTPTSRGHKTMSISVNVRFRLHVDVLSHTNRCVNVKIYCKLNQIKYIYVTQKAECNITL